jgi:arylsulfatase A-like enzyme
VAGKAAMAPGGWGIALSFGQGRPPDGPVTRLGAMRQRPNMVFVMSDDHAAHAIGAYGSRVNATPHLDRLAAEGMRFDNCFCSNSICAPSRAAILTGTYNHVNGVTTLSAPFDSSQPTFPAALHADGYQSAIFGKWHLGHGVGHDPVGFDEWRVLPEQGEYHDPEFLDAQGSERVSGYVTDIITDLSLDWISRRDPARPFCLLLHHKAPHRSWEPAARHQGLYAGQEVREPVTFRDDYANRSTAASQARMRMTDLWPEDVKEVPPEDLVGEALDSWLYQRFIKEYLRCVASIDDNMGRLLDYMDAEGLTRDTVVVYTSDQGFFLGDHGWFDKRFMYEESLRMPLLVRYPAEVPAASVCQELVLNVDFAQTLLDLAGVPAPSRMQGRSLRGLLRRERPSGWRRAVYYRYWEHDDGSHGVWAHYGVRTERYKLIYYYNDGLGQPGASDTVFAPEWELFDLESDPYELTSVYDDPAYATVREDLTRELRRQQHAIGDRPHPSEGRSN